MKRWPLDSSGLRRRWTLWGVVWLALLFSTVARAQDDAGRKKVEILNADRVSFDKKRFGNAQNLYGHVALRHQGILMHCDSARLYEEENRMQAFGHVRFNQGDTLILTGDRANYNGNSRIARVLGDVTLSDPKINLETPSLTYYRNTATAVYTEGAYIVSKENDNKLYSNKGNFLADRDLFQFRDSVVLENADYTIATDTMHYHTPTEQAYFFGPTVINSDSNRLFCRWGWYDTRHDLASFSHGAALEQENYRLESDSLYYDRNKGLGQAFGNVWLRDSLNGWNLFGSYGELHEKTDSAIFPNDPLMMIRMEDDSLFMESDTVIFRENSVIGRQMVAFHQTRFYARDFRGICDSVIYTRADSLLRMRMDPVMWSEKSQITGNKIDLVMGSSGIHEMRIPTNAFIVESFDSLHYNQVKGRTLRGVFKDNELRTVYINGNGETIYYVIDEKPDSLDPAIRGKLIGINQAQCSNMRIELVNQGIDRIIFLTEPQSELFPASTESEKEYRLRDFHWREHDKPKRPAKADAIEKRLPMRF